MWALASLTMHGYFVLFIDTNLAIQLLDFSFNFILFLFFSLLQLYFSLLSLFLFTLGVFQSFFPPYCAVSNARNPNFVECCSKHNHSSAHPRKRLFPVWPANKPQQLQRKLTFVPTWCRSRGNEPIRDPAGHNTSTTLWQFVMQWHLDDEEMSVNTDLIAWEYIYCKGLERQPGTGSPAGGHKSIWTTLNSQLQYLTWRGQLFPLVHSSD